MQHAPNWRQVEETLFDHGQAAIEQFAREHADELCSFFAYNFNPVAGHFAICLDTYFNGIEQAMKYELDNIGQRQMSFKLKNGWRVAPEYTQVRRILTYTYDTELFHYPSYREVCFEGWSDFFDSEEYPQGRNEDEDYFTGSSCVVLWRVFERLIKAKLFQRLHMSAPFRLGYQVEDHELVVMRILNWPTVEGPPLYSVLEAPFV